MKVIGTVAPEEVPIIPGQAGGTWTRIATQALEAHAEGKVLVVQLADREELKRMSNGVADYLRRAGFGRRITAVDEPDGVRVYLGLEAREETNHTVVTRPLSRRRRRANGNG